jgi:hypothetical protein
MVEYTRRLVASGIAIALLVGLLATSVAAQPADEATPAAGINADKVDGLHAVRATGKKAQRKNRLVATDSTGYLPGNIVKPLWGLIQGLPAILADGQVSWAELLGIPAAFADGVDNEGVTGIRITRVMSDPVVIAPGAGGIAVATCPSGRVVGGGFTQCCEITTSPVYKAVEIEFSYPEGPSSWEVWGTNRTDSNQSLYAYAVCMTTEPAAALTVAKKNMKQAKVIKSQVKKQKKRGQ